MVDFQLIGLEIKQIVILMIVLILLVILFILIMLGYYICNQIEGVEKMTVFECGFDSIRGGRVPFSLQFFIVCIVFIVFDVEIALILPFPLVIIVEDKMWLFIILVFIILLVLGGLYFEWVGGCLKWVY